jgi:hypothetical protein
MAAFFILAYATISCLTTLIPHISLLSIATLDRSNMKTKLILILLSSSLFGCSNNGMSTACRTNLNCRAQNFIETADMFCKERIEQMSRGDVHWDHKREEDMLSRYEWKDKAKGTITYFGDKALIKTPAGIVREKYECDIDPDKPDAPVLNVRVAPE